MGTHIIYYAYVVYSNLQMPYALLRMSVQKIGNFHTRGFRFVYHKLALFHLKSSSTCFLKD
jgi:hypothetical protein